MGSDSKNILVIDDSNTNVVLLQAVLKNKGYTIDIAFSAKEAMHIINKHFPDLILLDLLMPRINGFEFLTDLKANEMTKHIPVIVVSALADQESLKKAMDLGAVEYIKKPVDIQKLVAIVASVLKQYA